MTEFNPQIFIWARESAGLGMQEAARALSLKEEKLQAIEAGAGQPSHAQLLRMSKEYRRSLLTFYLEAPPPRAEKGQDFRTLKLGQSPKQNALVDALLRDIHSRQALVKSALEDDEDAIVTSFVGAAQAKDGATSVLRLIEEALGISRRSYRATRTPEFGFSYLRAAAERAGVFVLLAGNLGSHHSSIPVEVFRGFAIADSLAPFIVINDQDAKAAWSFTLMHELAHLCIGESGLSAGFSENAIEKFCNDVAGEFFISSDEIDAEKFDEDDIGSIVTYVEKLSRQLIVSRPLAAYRLFKYNWISQAAWETVDLELGKMRAAEKARAKDLKKIDESGPSYYVVKRHRLGTGLLDFVSRSLSLGILTPAKAAHVLGVKPRSVHSLLSS